MQAQVEGLALRVADNKTGYFGVYFDKPGRPKPFKAEVKRRGGKTVSLGCFATAEEAALCVARTPEGRAVVPEKAVAPPPMTGEEVRQQAQAEGLALLVADNKTGFFAVGYLPGRTKPYQAKVTRDPAKQVHLRSFATAEEAALCVARSPEGQAAAAKAAAAPPPPPLTSEQARQQAQAEGLTLLRVAGTKTGYSCVFHNNPSQPPSSSPRGRERRARGRARTARYRAARGMGGFCMCSRQIIFLAATASKAWEPLSVAVAGDVPYVFATALVLCEAMKLVLLLPAVALSSARAGRGAGVSWRAAALHYGLPSLLLAICNLGLGYAVPRLGTLTLTLTLTLTPTPTPTVTLTLTRCRG